MAQKVYAVARGRKTGLFDRWDGDDGARAQVDGFQGARHRSFLTRAQAEDWLSSQPQAAVSPDSGISAALPPVQSALPLHAEAPAPAPANAPAVAIKPAAGRGTLVAEGEFPPTAPQIAVHLHAEGAAPLGSGAYAVLLLHDGREVVFAGAHTATTANRQHLRGLLTALEFLKCGCRITVHSASGYTAERVGAGRFDYWRRHNWDNEDGSPTQHADLWTRLAPLLDRHRVSFVGADPAYGERLRALAATALAATPLAEDHAQPPWQAEAPE